MRKRTVLTVLRVIVALGVVAPTALGLSWKASQREEAAASRVTGVGDGECRPAS
jgi:hypothetical protein